MDPVDYQIVISLSHAEIQQSNKYFKHENGLEKIDKIRGRCDLDFARYANISRLENHKMECIGDIQVEFNKAIFIESQYFHVATHGFFGNDLESCRLVEIISLNILSYNIPRSLNAKYSRHLFYFEESIPESLCDESLVLFQDYINKQKHCIVYMNHPVLLSFQKFANEYINFISSSIPMLEQLFEYRKDVLNTTLHYEYLPLNFVQKWKFGSDQQCPSFKLVFNLEDSDDVHQVFDSSIGIQTSFPIKKRSLLIYPNSWLYPFSQKVIVKPCNHMIAYLTINENKFSKV
jgi:hypothetical protein